MATEVLPWNCIFCDVEVQKINRGKTESILKHHFSRCTWLKTLSKKIRVQTLLNQIAKDVSSQNFTESKQKDIADILGQKNIIVPWAAQFKCIAENFNGTSCCSNCVNIIALGEPTSNTSHFF